MSNPRESHRKNTLEQEPVSPADPVWFDALSPLGSAVRYVAGLSSAFHWVGIYRLDGDTLVLGPFLGEETEHREIPVGVGVCGTAVAENRDQNVPDVRACSNYLSCSLKTRSELVVLVRDRKGSILGQIDIDSHFPDAFGEEEETAVRQVAKELGERWPE
jgi:L-methionine (R)-S-oxide reductase